MAVNHKIGGSRYNESFIDMCTEELISSNSLYESLILAHLKTNFKFVT